MLCPCHALVSSQPSQIRRVVASAQPNAGIGVAQVVRCGRGRSVLGLGALVKEVEVDPARLDRDAEEELALAEQVEAALDLGVDQTQPRVDVPEEEARARSRTTRAT